LLIAGGCVGAYVLLFTAHRSVPPQKPGYSWKLSFGDEFNGSILDKRKWVTCYDWYDAKYNGCSNNGNNEQEWYSPSNVTQHDGSLKLTAVKKSTVGWNKTYEQDYAFQSGMVSTGRASWNEEPKWTGKYGYFEARMKVDGGKGIWPAFWLLPADHSWPPEIDVMELLGDRTHEVLMTYHWPGLHNEHMEDSTSFTGSDFTKGWHTYAVNWQPGEIDWYIDGVLRKSVKSNKIPDKSMELVLNLAVGGKLPGSPDDTTHFPAEVSVDYVRVYSLIKN